MIPKGYKFSEEAKRNMSMAKKGKMPKFIPDNKGVIRTDENKIKISEGLKKYYANNSPWNKGKKFPERSGSNSPSWIKDRTKLKVSEKKHLDSRYKEWMLAVKQRDNWKCQIKNSDCKNRLESHHILNWIDYPELRYIVNNGITLCQAHHPQSRIKEKQMSGLFNSLVALNS